jgi:type II secretory ATPase GspE/PulE/Tfp pilus assembly ATPase PilB-like protein/DNA-binding NarL/FixJ family response regulator
MLVEDNVIYRELLRELCEFDGHEVLEASRAEDAMDMLRNYGESDVLHGRQLIDLFITDFNMDTMNGYEFIQAVRSRDSLREVPIIMISSTNKDISDLLRLNGVAFLPKPSSNIAVMENVRRLLDGAGIRSEAAEAASSVRPSMPIRKGAKLPTIGSVPPPPTPPAPIAAIPQAPPPLAAELPPAPPAPETELPPVPPPSPPAPITAPVKKTHPVKSPAKTPSKTPSRIPGEPPRDLESLEVPDDGIRNHIAQSAGISELLGKRDLASSVSITGFDSASSPVAELLDKILDSAVHQRASDIHLEPQAGVLDVRLRIDGVLQTLIRLPASVTENLTARIKIVCSLNITEKRLPQDGQFFRKDAAGRATKFRVSTLPAVCGEKVVLRVLPAVDRRAGLEAIGFTFEELALLRQVLHAPNGVVLVTGPTGSGKTSTLYTMLDSLNSRERNIVTVEDPVEYQLPGITQVQVNQEIGYTFGRVLRSFLRQDPDVMLVGEIRDAETAEIALKAAVTGHLVLSTLHTNDAVGAVHRLQSMGCAPYLIAAAARLVIAQRLVRVLCPKCKIAGRLSAAEACLIAPREAEAMPNVWHPGGCASCHGIGYQGRRVVLEMLPILSADMRGAIAKSASPDEMKALADKEGLVPMRRNALRLVAEGVTSLEEVLATLYV